MMSDDWDAEDRSDGDASGGEICSEIELECSYKSFDEPQGAILRSKPLWGLAAAARFHNLVHNKTQLRAQCVLTAIS
jgi:hypothetical protein